MTQPMTPSNSTNDKPEFPYDVEYFTNGEITLKVYHYSKPHLNNLYFLQVGDFAGLELRDQEFSDLKELMEAYIEEEKFSNPLPPWRQRLSWIAMFITIWIICLLIVRFS